MDPASLAAAAAASAASKAVDTAAPEGAKVGGELVKATFMPSAQVLGKHLAQRLEDALQTKNAERVLRRAAKKVRADRPGIVTPRVALETLEGAALAEDEVMAEYLSGVLASSRTTDSRDDRGVAWAALVRRLSADQLRLHFLLYMSAHAALANKGTNVADICGTHLIASIDALFGAMQIAAEAFGERFNDAFYGLHREGLIGDYFSRGPADHLRSSDASRIWPDHGVIWTPSRPGLALFLWGLGCGEMDLDAIAEPGVSFEVSSEVEPPAEPVSVLVTDLPLVEEAPPLAD